MMKEWNSVLLIAFVCFGCSDQVRQPEKLPEDSTQVSISAPPIAVVPDTSSGYFKDFNFFTLRGEGAIEQTQLSYPYAEVRFRNDSVFVMKWNGRTYPSIFKIRLQGNRGFFSERRSEKYMPEDSYLIRYRCTPDYLLRFEYSGNTDQPHNWRLHYFQIVGEGPIVFDATLSNWEKDRPINFDLPTRNEIDHASLIRYSFKNGMVNNSSETVIGSFGDFHQSDEWDNRHSPDFWHSLFWTYFERYIVTE